MFEREERELLRSKERLAVDAAADLERLEAAVRNGMRQAQENRKLARAGHIRLIALSAGLLCLVLIVSIRVSPAMASIVGQLPGMGYIVKLIEQDRGLKQALENDFIQPVGISDEKDGIKLTVDGVIADESRLHILYTAQSTTGSPKPLRTAGIKLEDGDGAGVKGMIACCYPNESDGKDGILRGQVDVTLSEGVKVPERIRLQVELREDVANPKAVWEVSFPIDRDLFAGMKETLPIGQTLEIEGQKLTFTKATVYPTRIGLEVEFDPANTKQIFGLEDLELVTDRGTILKRNTGWLGEEKQTIYFESDYFSQSKRLTVKGSKLQALDKSKRKLIIDMDREELVRAPDERLRISHFAKTDRAADITLETKILVDEHYMYRIVDEEFTDSEGNNHKLSKGRESSYRTGSDVQNTTFHIEVEPGQLKGKYTFTIVDYPARIEKPFEVKIR
ncbi:DUF4179 domain-containing protein [Paenibacillus sp. MBLB4367]|uniref:DUF4179 domain-containing protein n=1 Tax=Paenibacillus sp. MBLB4367 TaxID=3384767 RepID=UPI003907E8CA